MADCRTAFGPVSAAFFAMEDDRSGKAFGITVPTLVQCLIAAERLHVVPPLEPEWREFAEAVLTRESDEAQERSGGQSPEIIHKA